VNLEAHCAGELNLQLCGELCGIIDKPMFLPSPKEICIDDSLASYFTSSSNILAVLAIANSFRKLCLTAKENHVA